MVPFLTVEDSLQLAAGSFAAGSFNNTMNAQKGLRSRSRTVFLDYVTKGQGFYLAAALRVREAGRSGCPPREAPKPSKAATVEWAAAGHEEGVLESGPFQLRAQPNRACPSISLTTMA
jgi:hypothetical protein